MEVINAKTGALIVMNLKPYFTLISYFKGLLCFLCSTVAAFGLLIRYRIHYVLKEWYLLNHFVQETSVGQLWFE